jgi:hypothetical protein
VVLDKLLGLANPMFLLLELSPTKPGTSLPMARRRSAWSRCGYWRLGPLHIVFLRRGIYLCPSLRLVMVSPPESIFGRYIRFRAVAARFCQRRLRLGGSARRVPGACLLAVMEYALIRHSCKSVLALHLGLTGIGASLLARLGAILFGASMSAAGMSAGAHPIHREPGRRYLGMAAFIAQVAGRTAAVPTTSHLTLTP